MPLRIGIYPQEQIKLILLNLNNTVQVSRLKHTIKNILFLQI